VAATSSSTSFYFNFNFPLQVVQLILSLLLDKPDPTTPAAIDPAVREWFSNPRPGSDPAVETITVLFKLPLSVSRLDMNILRVPCVVECWYQDRSNNWRQMLDETRAPLRVIVNYAATKSYYTWSPSVYPIVAKQVQFRITRYVDPTLTTEAYIVGLTNCLIHHQIYTRSQGQQYLEDQVDVLGNIVTRYFKDWDATKAIDNNPNTFWKSAPMPDPAAVTSLYLDVRDEGGGSQVIDQLYLDPVYTGSMLNLYYSSDDTVGTLKLNPITIIPDMDENTSWTLGSGRSDLSDDIEESYYRWPFAVGPQISAPVWIGVQWAPDFDPGDAPPQNPVLYRNLAYQQVLDWIAVEDDPTTLATLNDLLLLVPPDVGGTTDGNGTFRPWIFYDTGGLISVSFYDGVHEARTYSATLSPSFRGNR
jgi:hypothetical protein